VNFRRLRTGLGLVAFLVVATAGAGIAQVGANPNAPPPPPLPSANATATAPPTSAPTAGSTLAPVAVPPTAAPATAATPTPFPSPSSRPRRGHRSAPASSPSPDASDTPEPPQFQTLDGIWEVELQPLGHRLATYQHFMIVQQGSTLSGYWQHAPHQTKTPITGTFDGRLIQINAAVGNGTVTFTGYVQNMGDMVGMQHLTAGDVGIAFTAQHRKKDK
jgi:hypothetical protein